MPTIADDGKFSIRVHVRNEHPPPHVHVYYDGKVKRVSLYDLRVMDRVPKHEEAELVAVAKKYRRQALVTWASLNEGSSRK
jgi:hypothetical protein